MQVQPGSRVFNHYFPDKAAETVKGVFDSIIGNENGVCGDLKLSQISVRTDAPPGRPPACTLPSIMAELEDWTTSNPKMIICPNGLKHGNIEIPLPWPGIPPPVVCDDQPRNEIYPCLKGLGERTSWRMSTLGSVILH